MNTKAATNKNFCFRLAHMLNLYIPHPTPQKITEKTRHPRKKYINLNIENALESAVNAWNFSQTKQRIIGERL